MFNNSLEIITQILGDTWIEKQLDAYQLFRKDWSPKGRWYHRRPTVPPIIPIIYWNTREVIEGIQKPFGSWGGVPIEVLNRIAEEIERFREYWESLPRKRGIDNLKWALSNPQRFFSLVHELAIAFQFASKPGLQVVPLFHDPQSTPGKPDIIVQTPKMEFAVQCKSEDPSQAMQLPYDIFQYFAGMYQRLVEDSNNSYNLTLCLKRKIDIGHIYKIRNKLVTLIRGNIIAPYPWSTTYCDFELTEIGNKLDAQSLDQVMRRVVNQTGDPLYFEFVPILDDPGNITNRRAASLFVFGRRGKELGQVIRLAVSKSVKEADTSLPLIIAVHLYQDVDLEEFWNRPSTQQHLKPWTDLFFKENPRVAMIFLSSNYEQYLARAVSESQIGLKHARKGFVLESPVWDHKDVEDLGI